MPVVSFRVDKETLQVLKAHQVNISQVARRALGAEARRLKGLEAVDRLARLELPLRGPPSEDVVRRQRDERDARR